MRVLRVQTIIRAVGELWISHTSRVRVYIRNKVLFCALIPINRTSNWNCSGVGEYNCRIKVYDPSDASTFNIIWIILNTNCTGLNDGYVVMLMVHTWICRLCQTLAIQTLAIFISSHLLTNKVDNRFTVKAHAVRFPFSGTSSWLQRTMPSSKCFDINPTVYAGALTETHNIVLIDRNHHRPHYYKLDKLIVVWQ